MDSDYSRLHQTSLSLATRLLAVPVFILSSLLFSGRAFDQGRCT